MILALLFGLGVESLTVNAAGSFYVSGVTLDHRSVSFDVEDADEAQTATVTIDLSKDEGNEQTDSSSATHIEMSFEITNYEQSVKLTFPDGIYLESDLYYTVTITDKNNQNVYNYDNSFDSHSLYYSEGLFQPTGGYISSVDEETAAASVFVGFNEYKGTKSGSNYFFTYPKQASDTSVKVVLYDEYGCKSERSETIEEKIDAESKDISGNYTYANNAFAYLIADEHMKYRLCATVADKDYFGEYVQGKEGYNSIKLKVSYPAQTPSTKIKFWIESDCGAKTNASQVKVYNRSCTIKVKNTRTTGLTAYLYDNKNKTVYKKISKAILTLNKKEYKGKLSSNQYKFSYKAKVGDKVTIKFVDTDGYTYTKSLKIPQGDGKLDILTCNADRTVFRFKSSYSKIKSITLTANGKKCKVKNYTKSDYKNDKDNKFCEFDSSFKYNSDWTYKKAEYLVRYNKKVSIKLVTKDGYVYTKTSKADFISPYLKVDNLYSTDSVIKGETNANLKVTIQVGKKKYVTKADKNGNFTKKIKPAKSGTKVKVTALQKQTGCWETITNKIKIHKGSIKFNGKIYSTDKSVKITYTNAKKGDKIKLIANGITYHVPIIKNKKKTVFTFPTGQIPAGRKLRLYYTDSFGTKKAPVKTITTKVHKGTIKFNGYIFKTTNSVKITYTNAKKGDIIKLIANGKTYNVSINKSKKKASFTFQTGQMPAGAKLKLYYTDSFGTKKASVKNANVLYSKDIYYGMPARYCELTPWGRAVWKQSYGNKYKWYFEHGTSYLFAYIEDGKVYLVSRTYYS